MLRLVKWLVLLGVVALATGYWMTRPVKLDPRAVAWVESEVDAWIAARIEARDDAAVAS